MRVFWVLGLCTVASAGCPRRLPQLSSDICGDGVATGAEECDDGNGNSDTPDALCRRNCQLRRCGDGIQDMRHNEQCDQGVLNSDALPNACRSTCALPSCGDAVIDTGETCDAGGENSDATGAVCRSDCREARCGDGIRDPAELCDGADFGQESCVALALGFDGGELTCTSDCEFNLSRCAICGNGKAEPGESCDGIDTAGATCATAVKKQHGAVVCGPQCTLSTDLCHTCGDGVREGPEDCDQADFGATSTCQDLGYDSGTLACSFLCLHDTRGCGICGNLLLDGDDVCDDGNKVVIDGCDDVCAPDEAMMNQTLVGFQYYPAVAAAPGDQLVLAWQGSIGVQDGIATRILAADGRTFSPESAVKMNTTDRHENPSVSAIGDRYAVAWESRLPASSATSVHYRRVHLNGTVLGTDDVDVAGPSGSTGQAKHTGIALRSDRSLVIAWEQNDGDPNGWNIKARIYDPVDAPGVSISVSESVGNQEYPALAQGPSENFFVVWQSDGQDGNGYDIYGRAFDADGSPLAGEVRINETLTGHQRLPSVASTVDGWVVVWASAEQDGAGFGVIGRVIGPTGGTGGTEFLANTSTGLNEGWMDGSVHPGPRVAAAADGSFVITWARYETPSVPDGIYLQRFSASGVPQGGELRVNRYFGTMTAGPSIALLADGRMGVIWMVYGLSSTWDVVFQRLTAEGQLRGSLGW